MVLGLNSTRMARNRADWFQLLCWLRLTDTQFAKDGKVYDLRESGRRLLLGVRGDAVGGGVLQDPDAAGEGLRSKTERGELYRPMPSGFVREGRRVLNDLDVWMRHAIRQVFATFPETGSARRPLQALREDGTRLPAPSAAGTRRQFGAMRGKARLYRCRRAGGVRAEDAGAVESQWPQSRPRRGRATAERSARLTLVRWPSGMSQGYACALALAKGTPAASLEWRCSPEPTMTMGGSDRQSLFLPSLAFGQGTKSAAYAPLRKTDWFEAPSSHVPITPRGPSRLAPTNLPVCALRPDHRVEARNESR